MKKQLLSYSLIGGKSLVISLLCILFTTNLFANTEESVGGPCGDNAYWSLTDGVLTISGSGDMWILIDYPWADYKNDIKSVNIKQGITNIGYSAFYDCFSLASIKIPNSVTRIEINAFCNCISLTSIKIPNSVTSIEPCAFISCVGLTSIIVEEGNPKYDSRNNCNAIIETASNTLITGCKNTVIPNTVTRIEDYAFINLSSLTSIEIPNSVTSIGDYALSFCSGLTSIEIPNSVTNIGNYAFYESSGLKLISTPLETPLAIDTNVFEGVDYDRCILFVPNGSLDLYKKAGGWKDFKNIFGSFSFSSSNDEDVNNDGKVNATDVMQIYNYILSH